MLNAIKMNVSGISNQESTDKRRYLSTTQKNAKKMEPWLKRVRDQKTNSSEILDEKAKIQILNIQQTKKIIDKPEEYTRKAKVHLDLNNDD